MKFIHLSDLHIGKRFYERSLLADQRYILDRITEAVKDERPDAVFIAGDIYDKAVPGAEAVALFDDFLVELSELCDNIFVISGNHDSAERIAFGSRLIEHAGVYLSPVFSGKLTCHKVKDEYGDVSVYMLPFVRLSDIRPFFPDKEFATLTDGIREVIDNADIPDNERTVLIAHQFVAGAGGSGSETSVFVGGTDMVNGGIFDRFSYTALGHIHRPQNISDRIRYCGTPMKYDFSECEQDKSITAGEIAADGGLKIRTVPLEPLHGMITVSGTFSELLDPKRETDDYVRVTLTDADPVPDAAASLRKIYHGLCEIRYDNVRTQLDDETVPSLENAGSHLEIFSELYRQQNGEDMDEYKLGIMKSLIEELQKREEIE